MKWFIVSSAIALSGCGLAQKAVSSPGGDPKEASADDKEAKTDEGSDVDADAGDGEASGGVTEAVSGPCKGPEDCKGGYCARGPIGDAQCTNSPDIVNTVILCKADTDCKDLCVAFKGSEQCGQKEGTCNCDGPEK